MIKFPLIQLVGFVLLYLHGSSSSNTSSVPSSASSPTSLRMAIKSNNQPNINQSNVSIPIIDMSPLQRRKLTDDFCTSIANISQQIHIACKSVGFFYIINHGIPLELIQELQSTAKNFFALPTEVKNSIRMKHGGIAWRGYFNVGEEMTSGIEDIKEGIYFGTELFIKNKPLHGQNLWPPGSLGTEMRRLVLPYITRMRRIGHQLMKAVACSLQLREEHFGDQFKLPLELFRIFNYPPHNLERFHENSSAVGEHTDYGYLTILHQDYNGGLQIRINNQWIDAPPIENSLIINLGDALEHNTQGLYKATPHRVVKRLNATTDRLSMPYFYDPSFDSEMKSIVPFLPVHLQDEIHHNQKKAAERHVQSRWDQMDPSLFTGTYGNYLLKKVSKAFPQLAEQQGILEPEL